MRSRLSVLLLCITLPTALLWLLLTAVQPVRSQTIPDLSKLDESLTAVLASAAPQQTIRFIVHLQDTADLQTSLPPTLADRRATVVQRLQQTAVAAQTTLQPQLASLSAAGDIQQTRDLWIINAVAVRGTPRAVALLANQPQVSRITLDAKRPYIPQNDALANFNLETTLLAASQHTATIKNWGLNQIRAPHVWQGLGIDGSGVTVAIMDSGVDWTHPDLLPNYRGNLGNGSFDHADSWYYAVTPTLTTPFDLFGHGTHVAGTAVGQNGFGVAPGADWIAVGLTDQFGLIYESDVHAGFQWLLAPNGNPARAPDVINNSWGAPGEYLGYVEDVAALRAADIITVFAAGNTGPYTATIGAPASYFDTIAVGASDELGELAWFSSRGPSLLTSDIRPQLIAPGTQVLSTYPTNRYAYATGTSMATPHTTGAIALLLAANPTLNQQAALQVLTQTATAVSPTPNFDSGWGLLDIYRATATLVPHGQLHGQLRADSQPLPHTALTITTPSGYALPFISDSNGRYTADLAPGTYTLTAKPFGYTQKTITNITIAAHSSTIRHIDLVRLPSGTVNGRIQDASGQPLTGVTVSTPGAPVTTQTDTNGRYQLILPPGQYKLEFSHTGYAIGRRIALVHVNQTTSASATLTAVPAVLLVDAGAWSYSSQAASYHDALNALNTAHDTLPIRHPLNDVPTSADLAAYDVVIWSDPLLSPGTINASQVITGYLETGGNMILSGQNIGAIDGSGFPEPWWYISLGAQFEEKTAVTHTISGLPTSPFAGLSLTLNGGSSANNQIAIDSVTPHNNSLALPTFTTDNGHTVGLNASDCQPHRAVYLGFGLEGVTQAVDRAALLQKSFAFFNTPRDPVRVQWRSPNIDDFAVPGRQYTYTLNVLNMSHLYTDTISIVPSQQTWPLRIISPTLTLGPCDMGATTVVLTVPPDPPPNTTHDVTLTAVSSLDPAQKDSLHLHHKTPGHILLVDDDRWYDQESLYQAQLDALGLTYDTWSTGWRGFQRGSPPDYLLREYDFIIWYTGYDWFAPVTAVERAALQSYLDHGGRLFLSSQDFLFYHHRTPLAQHYLGVAGYYEAITPTLAFAANTVGLDPALTGPLPLRYGSYRNFSDGILPTADSNVLLWHDRTFPAAIGHAANDYRAVLMAIPFETLPSSARAPAMNRIMGYLTDLAGSTIAVDQRTAPATAARTYTITVRNATAAPHNQITLQNPLPPALTLVPGSLSGAARYDAATRQIRWSGSLPPGSVHQIVYRATVDAALAGSDPLENRATFTYARHPVSFSSVATTWLNAPNLSQSRLLVQPSQPFAPPALTYTLWLTNSGLTAANPVTAVLYFPPHLYPITNTLRSSGGDTQLQPGQLVWRTALDPNQSLSASLTLTRTATASPITLYGLATLQDGRTATLLKTSETHLIPYQIHLTLIHNN